MPGCIFLLHAAPRPVVLLSLHGTVFLPDYAMPRPAVLSYSVQRLDVLSLEYAVRYLVVSLPEYVALCPAISLPEYAAHCSAERACAIVWAAVIYLTRSEVLLLVAGGLLRLINNTIGSDGIPFQ